ncbi:O-antigen polysaccharide polymerase Wzy [Actinoplanes sp. N902-109]|uniref:O-antigen polysaccharide polymerase Wzy n=1 Tax=Actinoplanes sp. (strain N902-109) TaxID=649831 RepID=UPI0003293572|nr:O-antigen polysaccharide polymerase Wzy [Actinoplanes sp. N902-109]AGL16322.1 hypothetical protein L083_2812 [Actinoplanes sp. N902-109]
MGSAVNRLRAGRPLALALLASTGLGAAVVLRPQLLGLPVAQVDLVATLVAGLALTTAALLSPRRLLSAGFLYLLMLILFHLSIPVVLALGGTLPVTFAAYIGTWYGSSDVTEAVYLSMLAVLALTTAYAWVQVRRGGNRPAPHPPAPTPPAFTRIGAVLVAAGVTVYLGTLVVVAPDLLRGGSYQEYLDTVGGTRTVAGATLVVAIGLCMAAVGAPGRARTLAWLLFGVFTLVTLSFGARTAAMFPAVAGVVAAAACARRVPRARTSVALIVAGLLAITVVQQVRGTGLAGAGPAAVSLNPMGSFAETGGTLRTVAEVVTWRRTYQEPPYHGRTYLTPVVRAWELATGRPRPPGNQDPRYAGVLLYQRYPDFQLGFSPVAEAFLNFGSTGVAVLFAGLGALLAGFDRRRLGHLGAARLGVLMYALSYTVRNASNAVPLTLIAGLLVIWCAARLLNRPPRPARRPVPVPA